MLSREQLLGLFDFRKNRVEFFLRFDLGQVHDLSERRLELGLVSLAVKLGLRGRGRASLAESPAIFLVFVQEI